MNEKVQFKVGDYVKKNPDTWKPNEFDSWGRGEGIGQVVEPPFQMEAHEVEVRWPGGRCFENVDQLLPANKPENNENNS